MQYSGLLKITAEPFVLRTRWRGRRSKLEPRTSTSSKRECVWSYQCNQFFVLIYVFISFILLFLSIETLNWGHYSNSVRLLLHSEGVCTNVFLFLRIFKRHHFGTHRRVGFHNHLIGFWWSKVTVPSRNTWQNVMCSCRWYQCLSLTKNKDWTHLKSH